MERTTISIPKDTLKRLRRIAAERQTSMASVVREALEEKAKEYRPRPRSLGMGCSQYVDTARQAGDMKFEPPPWR